MKAINRVLEALKTVKVGHPIGSDVLAKAAHFDRSVVLNAVIREKIIVEGKLKGVVTFEIVKRKSMIGVTRELTEADLALFVKAKKVKEPKAPRVKKEKVAKVSKRAAKAAAKEAEADLQKTPVAVHDDGDMIRQSPRI